MRIIMAVALPFENEIQFFDACKNAGDVLLKLGQKALDDGDIEQFGDTEHSVLDNEGDEIGTIRIEP